MRNLIKDAMGLETNIAHQKTDQFFRDIIVVCGQLKECSSIEEMDKVVTKLDAVVKKHTNLDTTWTMDSSRWPNAWVMLPPVHPNHPLQRHWLDYLKNFSNREVKKYLSGEMRNMPFYAQSTEGSIDLVNSKVSGVFTKVGFPCTLTYGIVVKDFTPEEIAAIILHEIGHAFTYLLWLSRSSATNIMIDTAWRDVHQTYDKEVRLKIIDDLTGKLEIEVDRDKLANTNSKEYFTTVLITGSLYKEASDVVGNEFYSYRNVEQLADQFASRHGATRALANVNYKLVKAYHKENTRSKGIHYAIEGIKAAIFLLSVPATFGYTLMLLLLTVSMKAVHISTYDDPKQRLKKIQDEVVVRLKDPNLPKNIREQYVDEYKFIKELLNRVNDNETLFTWVTRNITQWRRGQNTMTAFQLELERLLNNELFYQSNRLKSLSN